MPTCRFESGLSLPVALSRLAGGPVAVVAGGTDWYPALGDCQPPADALHVAGLRELAGICRSQGYWRIGAGVTWREVIDAQLPAAFDGLKQAARQVGSVQIQNAATLAGNLCNASPAADGVPPLLALDARVELASIRGTRQLPLQEFLLGVRQTARAVDELLTAIEIPVPDDASISAFEKLGAREYLVISIAMVAMNLSVDSSGRIKNLALAVGACSPVARRLTELEGELLGQGLAEFDPRTLVQQRHLHELSPLDDVRGSRRYRLAAVQEMLVRLLRRAQQRLAGDARSST